MKKNNVKVVVKFDKGDKFTTHYRNEDGYVLPYSNEIPESEIVDRLNVYGLVDNKKYKIIADASKLGHDLTFKGRWNYIYNPLRITENVFLSCIDLDTLERTRLGGNIIPSTGVIIDIDTDTDLYQVKTHKGDTIICRRSALLKIGKNNRIKAIVIEDYTWSNK